MKNIGYQLAAAITFFTRIPLWKIIEIPAESFKKILWCWPLSGWITGGFTALAWLGFSMFFPTAISLVLAFLIKIILTGGLHEDGLVDFFDGFGGGSTKEDTLRIMKDSHTGSYALIGMIFYYLLLFNVMVVVPKELIAAVIFTADPFSKMITVLMITQLPYARNVEQSKSKTLFDKLHFMQIIAALLFGLLPIMLLLQTKLWLAIILPLATVFFIFKLAKRNIGGYTGDICGATALLCELSFILALYFIVHNY